MSKVIIEPIAHIENDFTDKFGIPRQSGMSGDMISKIIFHSPYNDENALKGIEDYSHLWLIWDFSEFHREKWSPTVRPPRLGGNKRMGVFATRSPNRPNNLGLTLVKLQKAEKGILYVIGADLKNGTPIYDIKPYLPQFEAVTNAKGGFSDEFTDYKLNVVYDETLLSIVPKEKREPLLKILESDPRPSYVDDPKRIYGFGYADFEVKFKVKEKTLTIIEIKKAR